ncbi:MAG TPA: cytochrome c [Myxococcales bacterium]|nr:cytochrome c [Myxococcales bacterium]HIN86869.1 cytochrome c [Myxococcales bacterium]
MLLSAPMRTILIIAALLSLNGCNGYPTEAVSRCYPNEEACSDFVFKNEVKHSKPELSVGKDVYLARCSGCHGRDARGGGHSDRGNFRDADWHKRWSNTDLKQIITAGRGMKMPGARMPVFELDSLLIYIRSLSPKPAATPKTGY